MAGRHDRMKAVLTAQFAPQVLEIIDESALHAGHAGASGLAGGETHFQVRMVAGAFAGLGRLARQRAVNAALTEEFSSGLHALSLTLRALDEA